MDERPAREDFDTFEAWVTALAEYSDEDPLELIDDVVEGLGGERGEEIDLDIDLEADDHDHEHHHHHHDPNDDE